MPKSLKDGEVDELKARTDIVDIISEYVNLKKQGKNFLGLCPFHKEKTPSFSVDSSRQFFHCFGCGVGGDVINFVERIENMEFLESVEFIAKKVGYNLQYSYSGSPKTKKLRERLVGLNDLARKYYHYILFNSSPGKAAYEYLDKRGFKRDTLEKFQVGYSLNNWDNFSSFAQKRSYKEKELIEAGLSIKSKKGEGKVYDRFRGRIMFPIEDVVGKVIGFGGRILREGKQSAKYVNTPETKLYSKSKNIYNINRAKNSIVDKDRALIVEGYTDVMALDQHGINNVVASLGTALTTEQIKLLGRFTQNIVLVFDSDQAGISASMKGIERLKEYNERLDLYHENNINIEVVVLEKGYDPADYITSKGQDDFLGKISGAVNIIDFTINIIIEKYDLVNLNEKLRASNEVLKFLSTLSSKIIQEECIKKVAQKLDLKESLLFEEMLKVSSKDNKRGRFDSVKKEEKQPPLKKVEIEALRLMINGEGVDSFLNLSNNYFKFDDTKKLFGIIKSFMAEKNDKGVKLNFPLEISSGLMEDDNIRNLYNSIFFDEKAYKNGRINCHEVLTNLKKIRLSEKIDNIRHKMIEIDELRRKHELSPDQKAEYDRLYKKLIELEQKKLSLGRLDI